MSKLSIILVTVAAWFIGCSYSAYYYVTTILASPDIGPGYEQGWGFQLLMFAIVRSPFWLIGLIAVVAPELVMPKPGPSKLR
jgi:hypothetical protein